jgi:hypothetical protein
VISEHDLEKLIEVFNQQRMISGTSVSNVASDLLKLRRFCSVINEAYRDGEAESLCDLLDLLGRIL